jgi:Cu/Zn superoxide dismutase
LTYDFARRLIDVRAGEGPRPFESAKAHLKITETDAGSTFTIRIRDIDTSEVTADQTFGAHLHIGSCVKGDIGGLQAGGHYQHVPLGPLGANPENEVWFDLRPIDDGTAVDDTFVTFKVDPGVEKERSIVIHVDPTDPLTGKAGDRQACLPLHFGDEQ